jgi:hypothetical protein
MAASGHGYRAHLKTTVATSAAPYGYTLTIWTSGAVTTHVHGVPSAWEALLLLIGAVLGFAVAAAVAHGGPRATLSSDADHSAVRIWGGFNLVSVGGAIGLATAAAAALDDPVVWVVVGFVSTAIYLLLTAGQFMLAARQVDSS